MKSLKDYQLLLPLWLREDKSFLKFYSELCNIFMEISEARDKIISSFDLNNILSISPDDEFTNANLDLLASYFGINRHFNIKNGLKFRWEINEETGNKEHKYEDAEEINLVLSNAAMLRLIKFSVIRSNFDGTFKNVIDNYRRLFENDEVMIQFIEGELPFGDEVFPLLTINLFPSQNLHEDDLTLFYNGAYMLDLLGVIIRFTVGGSTTTMLWQGGRNAVPEDSDTASRWDVNRWTRRN